MTVSADRIERNIGCLPNNELIEISNNFIDRRRQVSDQRFDRLILPETLGYLVTRIVEAMSVG